jgi:hypothetical protein
LKLAEKEIQASEFGKWLFSPPLQKGYIPGLGRERNISRLCDNAI